MNETDDNAAGMLVRPLGAAVEQSPEGNWTRDRRLLSPDPRTRLDGWQARLARHFTRIAEVRREADWPVFALEHGLNASERDALMRDVHECVTDGPGRNTALPWIVYAAEIGYEYSGFEYWQTFEAKTPGWQKQWRDLVRSCFATFAMTYHGAVPEGDWAHQFNIIAWPITHGILPRDLQRQLAELLYDASTTFRPETFSSAEALGSHLQRRCHSYSSRFRQFAENITLLGQIALALLLQDSGDARGGVTGVVLEADTLARIVNDLSRERDARQWLAHARSVARVRVRGLSRIPLRGHRGESVGSDDRPSEATDIAELPPRPRFVLREQTPDSWQVRLELPNLAHLATRSPRVSDFLMSSQGLVAGATAPILAKGRIMREIAPTVALSSWPEPQTKLLSFSGAPPELEALLHAGFVMNSADHWLFVIRSNGEAHELSTRVLRTGVSYLLLQKKEIRNPAAGLGIRAVKVSCKGVFGLRIDVPEQASDALTDVLAILGLEVAQTLEVWPAGLPVSEWSGDGYAEWVAGQPIILGIRADRRLVRLTATIDGIRQVDLELKAESVVGDSVFLQLPMLRPGPHQIRIAAHLGEEAKGITSPQSSDGCALPDLSGNLSCLIREPRTAAAGQAGALSFAILPKAPSVEDVWEDRIDIHVAAPGVSSVRCRVVLRTSDQRELLSRQFTLPSPCGTDTWRHHFGDLRSAADEVYDDAQSCTITFEAGALGRAVLSAERDFRSLRWAVRENGRRAELVDMQGNGNATAVAYLCSAPVQGSPLDLLALQRGVSVENEGKLLVARRDGQVAALIVVPRQNVQNFSSLLVRPRVSPTGHSVAEMRKLIGLAQLWEGARLGGSTLSRIRQQACVQAIISAVFGALGGRTWETVEAQVRDGANLGQILSTAALTIAPGKADEATSEMFARRLQSLRFVSEDNLEERFVGMISWLTSDNSAIQCARFALLLTSSPLGACRWADVHPLSGRGPRDALAGYLDYLCGAQFIARAARYVRLQRLALLGAQ